MDTRNAWKAATLSTFGTASLIAVLSTLTAPALANVPTSPGMSTLETLERPALDLTLPEQSRPRFVDAAISPAHDWVQRRLAPRVTHPHYEEAPNFPLEHSGNLLFVPLGGDASAERR